MTPVHYDNPPCSATTPIDTVEHVPQNHQSEIWFRENPEKPEVSLTCPAIFGPADS
jgi:hypothetical protein